MSIERNPIRNHEHVSNETLKRRSNFLFKSGAALTFLGLATFATSETRQELEKDSSNFAIEVAGLTTFIIGTNAVNLALVDSSTLARREQARKLLE